MKLKGCSPCVSLWKRNFESLHVIKMSDYILYVKQSDMAVLLCNGVGDSLQLGETQLNNINTKVYLLAHELSQIKYWKVHVLAPGAPTTLLLCVMALMMLKVIHGPGSRKRGKTCCLGAADHLPGMEVAVTPPLPPSPHTSERERY